MKGAKPNASKRNANSGQLETPPDFPGGLVGEFTELDEQLRANIGTVAGLVLIGGGYFGISVTDDGGSCKLTVRTLSVSFERRFYRLAHLEAALAWCVDKFGS